MFKNSLKVVVTLSILAGGAFANAQEVKEIPKADAVRDSKDATAADLNGENVNGVSHEAKAISEKADADKNLKGTLKAREGAGFQYRASAKALATVQENSAVRSALDVAIKNTSAIDMSKASNVAVVDVLVKAAPEKAMALSDTINQMKSELTSPATAKKAQAYIRTLARVYAAEGPGMTAFPAADARAKFEAYKDSAALNNFLGIMNKYVEISKTVGDIMLRKDTAVFKYLKDLGLTDEDANAKKNALKQENCVYAA